MATPGAESSFAKSSIDYRLDEWGKTVLLFLRKSENFYQPLTPKGVVVLNAKHYTRQPDERLNGQVILKEFSINDKRILQQEQAEFERFISESDLVEVPSISAQITKGSGSMSLLRKPFIVSILISLVLIVAGCGKESVFDGSRSSNDKQFIMDYSTLNDTKTHEMKLKEGTIVNVIIQNESGRLDLLVANVEGQEIYRGDNASSGKFLIKIPKTGTYKFSVAGSKAKGGVSFKVAE